VRLLIDANLSPLVTGALRDAGHDVVHVGALGLLTASDLVILERAQDDERVGVERQ
jgi:predicted nuclease of predicted toxin-antitoxin system